MKLASFLGLAILLDGALLAVGLFQQLPDPKGEVLFHVETSPRPTRDRFVVQPILPAKFPLVYESGPRDVNAPTGNLSCRPQAKPIGEFEEKGRFEVLLVCGGTTYAIETIQFQR